MKYFGTDGIRGIYGEKLTDQLAYGAGLAMSQFVKTCFVGMDTRCSGEALAQALTMGLVHGGCDVKLVGIVPTPAISYLAAKYRSGGIMVSASHNPPEFNGLKFFAPSGYKLSSHYEGEIEKYIDRPPPRAERGKILDYTKGRNEYVVRLVDIGGNLDGREISLDCAYGAAITVAEEAFVRCGAKVRCYADSKEGRRINCGVGALYPSYIQSKTDGLGFAFDGDADRLAVCCDGVVDGDSVLYNLALLLKPYGVVGTVMNNIALELALKCLGVEFVRTAVGDKNISEAMRRLGFTLGGEQSGHYIVSPSVSGDALGAAMRLSRMDKFVRLELAPQKCVSIEASPDVMCCEDFCKVRAECERRLCGVGRLVVRMSGTEPKVRLMAEGDDERLLEQIIGILVEAIECCKKERV